MLIDLKGINWRKKLAVVVWGLCLLGSFLLTSSSGLDFVGTRTISGIRQISTTQRLVQISIPLVMVWVGSWLSDDDESALKRVFGIIFEIIGWALFARYIGFYLLGPLILSVS